MNGGGWSGYSWFGGRGGKLSLSTGACATKYTRSESHDSLSHITGYKNAMARINTPFTIIKLAALRASNSIECGFSGGCPVRVYQQVPIREKRNTKSDGLDSNITVADLLDRSIVLQEQHIWSWSLQANEGSMQRNLASRLCKPLEITSNHTISGSPKFWAKVHMRRPWLTAHAFSKLQKPVIAKLCIWCVAP